MAIFAIGDLHLSGKPPSKPMDCFSPNWKDHWEKIQTAWIESITDQDTVLIAGDISWAMKWPQALEDLAAIDQLPGRKILVRGNHDYWWTTVGKMNQARPDRLSFLHNNFYTVGTWAICGSRGWVTPGDPCFQTEDEPVYQREVFRTQLSLTAAKNAGFSNLLLLLHYPPAYIHENHNGFTRLLEEFSVQICVYGHIHGEAAHMPPQQNIGGAACHLVACDALDFKPKLIVRP